MFINLLEVVYPVGSIYLSFKNESPASFIGGTWEQITRRFLRMDNNIGTGGADTHTLTIAEMPSHTHTLVNELTRNTTWVGDGPDPMFSTNGAQSYTGYAGGSSPHNNMPAYQNVYAWKRLM